MQKKNYSEWNINAINSDSVSRLNKVMKFRVVTLIIPIHLSNAIVNEWVICCYTWTQMLGTTCIYYSVVFNSDS